MFDADGIFQLKLEPDDEALFNHCIINRWILCLNIFRVCHILPKLGHPLRLADLSPGRRRDICLFWHAFTTFLLSVKALSLIAQQWTLRIAPRVLLYVFQRANGWMAAWEKNGNMSHSICCSFRANTVMHWNAIRLGWKLCKFGDIRTRCNHHPYNLCWFVMMSMR